MKLLKDPKALERQATEAKERVAAVSVVGSAGGGMVKITLNGAMEMLAVEIAPDTVDQSDIAMLQDLIRAAFNDASAKVAEAIKTEVSRSMGGLGGLGFPGA